MITYAVNVADLATHENRFLGTWVVGPVVGETVNAEPERLDGMAVILDCPLIRARAIVDIIRLKRTKSQVRCYVRKSIKAKTWQKV